MQAHGKHEFQLIKIIFFIKPWFLIRFLFQKMHSHP